MKLCNFINYLFDFDGTLVNSNKVHEKAFRYTLKKNKISIKNFDYEVIKGMKTSDAFKSLNLKKNICKMEKEKKFFYKNNINKLKLFKGALRLILLLHKNKKKIYIVSGASKKNILFILKKYQIKVDGVISAENVKHSKPHPESYKTCLKKYSLDAAKSIAIENSRSGLTSAKKNKIYVVGVNNLSIKTKVNIYFRKLETFYSQLKKQIK